MLWVAIVVLNSSIYNGFFAWKKKGRSGFLWGLVTAAAVGAAVFAARAIAVSKPEWAQYSEGPALTIFAGAVVGIVIWWLIYRLPDPAPSTESKPIQ